MASPQPGQPPVLWVAGTLTAVSPERLELQEPSGATITLQRLGEGATAFFRISGGEWRRVAAVAGAGAEGLSCVETVMAGSNLVALRVFLGAGCGPA